VYPLKIEFLKKGRDTLMSVLKPLSKITITDLWKEVKDEESIWGDLKLEAQIMLKNLLEKCMEKSSLTTLRRENIKGVAKEGAIVMATILVA
jgi:hypothetical protein